VPQEQAVTSAAAVERAIAEATAEALGVPGVGRDDNLLELGVDSLAGARIVGRLRNGLGLDIPLLALFENPVVADLAEEILALAEQAG
jgi:acyl carrier protein